MALVISSLNVKKIKLIIFLLMKFISCSKKNEGQNV